MLVAFWSPIAGHGKTTSSMLAVSSMIGMDYPEIKSLVTTTNLNDVSLDKSFEGLRDTIQEDEGIRAIEQLVSSNRLNPQGLQNNTQFIIRDRLDLLSTKRSTGEEVYKRVLPFLLDSANKAYEISFFDIGSGSLDESAQVVLSKATLVVVCLPQNQFTIERNISEIQKNIEGKKVLYCLGAFDRKARLSVDKTARLVKASIKDMCAVPYNTMYMDAINNSDIIKYIMDVAPMKKKFLTFNEDVYFAGKLREFAKKILSRLEIVAIKEGEE